MVKAVRGLLMGIALALLVCCGGSSPTQPTTSTMPLSSVQISGPMIVLTGATIQLAATVTTGGTTTVASNATWQSQAPQIATVSSTGLVTGISSGQAAISATASGVTAQTFVTVQPPSTGTTVLKACGPINTPGSYTLANDLIGNGGCLFISFVAGLQLDCQGHSISGLTLTNVSSASVSNCTVTNSTLTIVSGSTMTLAHLTLANGMDIVQSQSIEISDSAITANGTGGNSAVLINVGSQVTLLRDTVTNTASTGGNAGIYFLSGMNNQVLQSTISGTYDGSQSNVGTDDGVVLDNQQSDTIQDNTISGFFDIGIEGVSTVANTSISRNALSNLGTGGIGSIWCTAWTNNIVQGNRTLTVPDLIFVGYQSDVAHCGASPPAATFMGNQFIGNVFRNQTMGGFHGTGPRASMYVSTEGTVTGNVLQGNDFGSYDGPSLDPLSGFIDGGGNICGPLNPAVSNFACAGHSASVGRLALLRTRRLLSGPAPPRSRMGCDVPQAASAG